MREKLDDQAKITFSLQLSLANLSINLHGQPVSALSNRSYDRTTLLINKLTTHIDINSIFQKFDFKLRKLLLFNENSKHAMNLADNTMEKLIINTGGDLLNQSGARQKGSSVTSNNHNNSSPGSPKNPARKFSSNQGQKNFMEVTVTRALVSNLNKRLNYSSSPYKFDKPKGPKNKPKYSFKKQVDLFRTSQKWIVETNCIMNELDLILHAKKFELIWEFSHITQFLIGKYYKESLNSKDTQSFLKPNNEPIINIIPLIRTSDMPLVNFEANRIRIIVPTSTKKGSGDFNCIVGQIMSLSLTSQIENPLIRSFLHNSISSNIYNK